MLDGSWQQLTDKNRSDCKRWGPAYCKEMAKPERAASRLHSILGVELDPVKQERAKLGEIVLAKTFGQPLTVLNWDLGKGDSGIDMTLDRDTFDAKTTWSETARFLMQSVKDVDRLEQAIVADKLVLVQLDLNEAGEAMRGRCRGYIQRYRFLKIHRIASDKYPRTKALKPMLIAGTPFVEYDLLDPMQQLIDSHRVKYFDEASHEAPHAS